MVLVTRMLDTSIQHPSHSEHKRDINYKSTSLSQVKTIVVSSRLLRLYGIFFIVQEAHGQRVLAQEVLGVVRPVFGFHQQTFQQ